MSWIAIHISLRAWVTLIRIEEDLKRFEVSACALIVLQKVVRHKS